MVNASRSFGFVIAVGAVFLSGLIVGAGQTTAQLLDGSTKVNSQFVPPSAFASVVAYPKKMADDPELDLLPREIITAWGRKEFGFDPMLLNQVQVVVGKFNNLQQPPRWAVVLYFDQMQGLAGSMIDQLEKKQFGGKTLFSGSRSGQPSFLVFDEVTIIAGDENFFAEMLDNDGSGRLVEVIKRSDVSGQIQAFADIESVRPLLNEAATALPFWLPPAVMKLKLLPDSIDAIEIGVKLDGIRATTDVVFQTKDAETAEKVSKILTEATEFGTDMLIGMLASQMDINDPVQSSVIEYTQRIAADLLKKWQPEISGSHFTIHFDEEATAIPLLVGMLLPAAQQARSAARRTQSMNNMRQMTLALHNYESAFQKFPTQAITDKNGKPLLSWRVKILPFIEQKELYDQFHLDEPWDSPHNKKLIDKMPPSYRSPSIGVADGNTVYLGVAGEGMMFGKNEIGFADITDGSSNTVLMVEANPELAVPWTQPADFVVDKKNPLRGLGNTQPGGIFIANMADGSVRAISNSVDPKMWFQMLTINGGEVIDQ